MSKCCRLTIKRYIDNNEKKPMTKTLMFDLSEVFIAGLYGVEKPLAALLGLPEEPVLQAFGGEQLGQLCRDALSEDAYLEYVIRRQGWQVEVDAVKRLIRQNFHHKVPGMQAVLERLAGQVPLVLLSDHAREWVEYIQAVHPFLALFDRIFYSYEIKSTKRSPESFRHVLAAIDCAPQDCIFVDDSPINVAVAAELGINAIQFTSAAELNEKLLEYGV